MLMCATLGFLVFLAGVLLMVAVRLRHGAVSKRYGMMEEVYKTSREYNKNNERELEMKRKSEVLQHHMSINDGETLRDSIVDSVSLRFI